MPEARNRINAEHKSIITALRKYDVDRLVEEVVDKFQNVDLLINAAAIRDRG